MDIVARAVTTHVRGHRGGALSAAFFLTREPLHGLHRQIGTGGLHCPDFTQRRLALFSLAALCVWKVDPAPNDPGLLAAKGGAAGGGCALMRTLGTAVLATPMP
jgi:hypothetical protein